MNKLNVLEAIISNSYAEQEEILKKWTLFSHKIFSKKDDPWIAFEMQKIGKIDVVLRSFELEGWETEKILLSLDMVSVWNEYWVLRLFEILRTSGQYSEFRKKLSFIRAPIVKHQVSGTRMQSNQCIVCDKQGRLGFRYFNPQSESVEEVLRTDLSEEFLELCLQDMN